MVHGNQFSYSLDSAEFEVAFTELVVTRYILNYGKYVDLTEIRMNYD